MKPITECSREERLERALLVIEAMFCGDEEDERSLKVYMIAHAATGRCCRGGDLEDWLQLIEKSEKEAADNNIMHVDRIFEKAIKY